MDLLVRCQKSRPFFEKRLKRLDDKEFKREILPVSVLHFQQILTQPGESGLIDLHVFATFTDAFNFRRLGMLWDDSSNCIVSAE